MDAGRWVRAFQVNRGNRREPAWSAPCALEDRVKRELGRSLAHFQLGESGGGTFLLRGANAQAALRDDKEYPRALALFIGEENEHARLLGRLCERYGASPPTEHWTHFLFHHLRQLAGVDFELIVLVTAELIGNAYYETLQAHLPDPPLQEAVRLILRDEALHVEFHLDRLADALSGRSRLARQLFALSFALLFEAALWVAGFDHRKGVRAAGASLEELFRRARAGRRSFLAGLRLAPAVSLS